MGTRMTITRVFVERPGDTEARDHYNQVTVQTSVHRARGPISIDVNTKVQCALREFKVTEFEMNAVNVSFDKIL